MKNIVEIVSCVLGAEDLDALYVMDVCDKLMKKDFLKQFLDNEAWATATHSLVQRLFSMEFYKNAERKALASAEATLTECKEVLVKLNHTCALPPSKDVAQWAAFEFPSDVRLLWAR